MSWYLCKNSILIVFISFVFYAQCSGSRDLLESWVTEQYKGNVPQGEHWVIVAEGCADCIERYSKLIRDRLGNSAFHFILSGTMGVREMYLKCGLIPRVRYSNLIVDSSGSLYKKGLISNFGAKLIFNGDNEIVYKEMVTPENFYAMMKILEKK